MPVAVLTLSGCDFFAHASQAALQFAAQNMQLLNLRRREVLTSTDEMSFLGLGVVLQGSVQAVDLTSDGREAALLTVATNFAFGHANLLAEQPINMTWVASNNPTTVAIMSRQSAQDLMNFPEMGLATARLLGQQVCDFLMWQKIQSIHPVSARVCACLQRMSESSKQLKLPTHAELAWRLNTTRESVNRVLQRLLADGILSRNGELWHVVLPDTLQDLAHGEDK